MGRHSRQRSLVSVIVFSYQTLTSESITKKLILLELLKNNMGENNYGNEEEDVN